MLFTPKIVLALSVLILTLHALALYKFYWYWTIKWFDMAMHAAGGFTIGILFVVLMRQIAPEVFQLHKGIIALFAISFAALVGVSWEFYEFLYDISIGTRGYDKLVQMGAVDTLSDLVFDLLGNALAILLYFIKKPMHKFRNI